MSLTDRLGELLFSSRDPTVGAYVVCDAARDDSLPALFASLGLRAESLFRPPVAEELARVAPRVARLDDRPDALEALVDAGWGDSSLLFLSASGGLELVRRHLRSFLKVELPDGRRTFFRHYDPRVLRRFVPALEGSDVTRFFGPIRRFACEDESGGIFVADVSLPTAAWRSEPVLPSQVVGVRAG